MRCRFREQEDVVSRTQAMAEFVDVGTYDNQNDRMSFFRKPRHHINASAILKLHVKAQRLAVLAAR